jgi:hypothetical protein
VACHYLPRRTLFSGFIDTCPGLLNFRRRFLGQSGTAERRVSILKE